MGILNTLKITAIADLHFGHPRINHASMYQNLCDYFYPKVVESDVVFICGDLFDTLLNFSGLPIQLLLTFIVDLQELCKEYGVRVRILHGTFSHDRNQPDRLTIFNSLEKKNPDLWKIVSTISTEEIVVRDQVLKVVYLPDSLSYKHEREVRTHVEQLFTMVGWDTADILIGHGTFDFTLPPGISLPPCTYTEDTFKDLITGMVVMGHIHVCYSRDMIAYTGSFERFSHNEERPKGFLYIERNEGKWTCKFIENKGASLFKTITLDIDDPDRAIAIFKEQVERLFSKYGYAGNVRVIHNNPIIRKTLSSICSEFYPNINYASKGDNTKTTIEKFKTVDAYLTEVSSLIAPTISNLPELVKNHIATHSPNKDIDIEDINSVLGITNCITF